MTQPFDRASSLPPMGDIDWEAGEFWVGRWPRLLMGDMNLSAYERNRMYLNLDGESFLDVSYASRADLDSDSRSAVWADFSGDGAPDLLVSSVGGGPLRMFYNRFPTDNHRLRLRLIGRLPSNRSGIGTRVIAHCGARRIVRDVFPANGFMGTGPAELAIGLGAAERIDRLVLRWPDGQRQEIKDVPVDRRITITQGQPQYQTAPLRPREKPSAADGETPAKEKPRSEP